MKKNIGRIISIGNQDTKLFNLFDERLDAIEKSNRERILSSDRFANEINARLEKLDGLYPTGGKISHAEKMGNSGYSVEFGGVSDELYQKFAKLSKDSIDEYKDAVAHLQPTDNTPLPEYAPGAPTPQPIDAFEVLMDQIGEIPGYEHFKPKQPIPEYDLSKSPKININPDPNTLSNEEFSDALNGLKSRLLNKKKVAQQVGWRKIDPNNLPEGRVIARYVGIDDSIQIHTGVLCSVKNKLIELRGRCGGVWERIYTHYMRESDLPNLPTID